MPTTTLQKTSKSLFGEPYVYQNWELDFYMVNLIWECRTHECKTVKDVQALSELYMNHIVVKCEGAVATFLECNKNICTNKQLMKDLVAESYTGRIMQGY